MTETDLNIPDGACGVDTARAEHGGVESIPVKTGQRCRKLYFLRL